MAPATDPATPDRPARWLPLAFILAALPLAVFLAVATPPSEAPDATAHIARADSVAHGAISGFRRQASGGSRLYVKAGENLVLMGLFFDPGLPLIDKHVTLARAWQFLFAPWSAPPQLVEVPNTGVYPPTFYLPAALAFRLAQAAGTTPFIAVLLARLLQAALYVAAGAAALRLARRGRLVLFGLLCLPASLWLAASVNPDGLVIAAAALSAALLTRQSRAGWWGGTLLLAAAAMTKPHLAPLALVPLAAYPGRVGGEAVAGLAVAALPAGLWAGAMSLYAAVPFLRPPATPAGPLWPGAPGTLFAVTSPPDQLRILLASPSRLLTLPLHAIAEGFPRLWREAIGVLGALDLPLPDGIDLAWAAALLLAFAAGLVLDRAAPATPARRIALLDLAILLGAVASVLAACLLLYVSWTRVGAASVEGLQGRYFLPVAAFALPMLALAPRRVPLRATTWHPAILAAAAAPVALAALANLAVLPVAVLFAYYLR